jgi:hypothetical protein
VKRFNSEFVAGVKAKLYKSENDGPNVEINFAEDRHSNEYPSYSTIGGFILGWEAQESVTHELIQQLALDCTDHVQRDGSFYGFEAIIRKRFKI